MPERVDFWGIPQPWGPILVYSIVTLAALVLIYRFYRQASLWWRVGLPEKRWDQPVRRLGNVAKYALVQVRVLSQRYPGIMHIAMAWAFFVFFLGTALATINGHFVKFLEGSPYLIYKFVLDIFTIFFLVGAAMAAYRRFIQKPDRLTLSSRFTGSLIFVTLIVLNGLLVESFRLAIERPTWALWSPAGWAVAQIWIATGASEATLNSWHLALYTLHFLTVAAFFVTLPATTLVHMFTAMLNIFFADLDWPMGRLPGQAQNKAGEPVYASSLKGLTWKQLLDGDTCTECGRCQDECPAYAAGAEMSPKQLVIRMRDALHRDGPAIESGKDAPILVGDGISTGMVWSCTTCGSCDVQCPVLIDHTGLVVEFRRYLVSEGKVDARLQEALANLSRYGNSFGQSERARTKWAATLPVKVKDARREPVETLWFVGDYASYNPQLIEVTRQTAEIFQSTGLDFGLLYEAERNSGNDVRRTGEEGLYEYLVEKNSAALAKATFKQIVTTDPHTYNTLKNEYPADAIGGRPVLHSSELLDQLISDQKIELSHGLGYRVTYHDPCYLGRYNQVYAAPRRVIAATGCTLVEMPHHGDRSVCCNAGGGRIWMDEGTLKERPSERRVREAAALEGVSVLVVACPKDLVMFRDAVKTTGLEGRLVVKELAELVHDSMAPISVQKAPLSAAG